jgi:hypothetical protein
MQTSAGIASSASISAYVIGSGRFCFFANICQKILKEHVKRNLTSKSNKQNSEIHRSKSWSDSIGKLEHIDIVESKVLPPVLSEDNRKPASFPVTKFYWN